MPPTLDVALDVAERAEWEFSDQPSLQPSTEDDCQDQSGPAKALLPSLWYPDGRGWGRPLPWHNDSGFPVQAGRGTGPETQATGPQAGAVSAGQGLRVDWTASSPSQPPAWPATGQTA